MNVGILVADGPRPPMRSANRWERKLAPEPQHWSAEMRPDCAHAAQLKSFLATEAGGLLWDQSRSCCYGDKFAVMSETVERLASEIRPLPRPHLVIPIDQAPIKLSEIDAIEGNERVNECRHRDPPRPPAPPPALCGYCVQRNDSQRCHTADAV